MRALLSLLLALNASASAPAWRWLEPPAAPFLAVSGVNLADFEAGRREQSVQKLSRQLYARYQDNADFLLLIGNRRAIPAGTPFKGYHLRVKNEVLGLGVPRFNRGAQYGGTQTLQGVLYFPNFFPFWKVPFIHEFAHQWGNDLLPSSEAGHFGFCGAGSQLGGFDSGSLRALGGGAYRALNLAGRPFGTAANGGNSVPYSDFELYLMGLLPAQAVKPFRCAEGGRWLNLNRGEFQATRMNTLTIADIQRRYGARQPDFRSSQKTFRVLAVLLSENAPTRQELAQVKLALQHLVSTGDDGDSNFTFNEATRGLGKLELVTPRRQASGPIGSGAGHP